jgi:phage gp45-like
MSINYSLMRELEERLRRYVDEKLASMISVSEYSVSSADGQSDKVKGYQTEGADEQPYDFSVRRLFPFGLRARPPSKAGVLGVRIGKGGRSGDGVVVGAESTRFGPSDLKEGEVALYNKVSGTVVKLDENGGATMTDAAGASVKLDGNGNVTVQAAAPNGTVTVTATAVTGAVKLGPVGSLAVLVQGTVDSLGVPVTQNPAASASIVKAG